MICTPKSNGASVNQVSFLPLPWLSVCLKKKSGYKKTT